MQSESGGGSEHCPSDFELSFCKTVEKELLKVTRRWALLGEQLWGCQGLSAVLGAPALGPQLGFLQEQLTGTAEPCCSWRPKPSLLSLL